jgi:hypothetical protein
MLVTVAFARSKGILRHRYQPVDNIPARHNAADFIPEQGGELEPIILFEMDKWVIKRVI